VLCGWDARRDDPGAPYRGRADFQYAIENPRKKGYTKGIFVLMWDGVSISHIGSVARVFESS